MWAAVGVAIVMVGQLVASRAIRDGFFLSHFEPTVLPSMVMISSILSIFIVLGSTRFLRRMPPARRLPPFFAANGALFFAEWALSVSMPKVAAIALYLHTMSLNAVVVSAFWSVVNERFDPHTARQLIGRIGGGATFGGVLGGVAVWLGASRNPRPQPHNLARMMRHGVVRNHLHVGSVNAAPRDFADAVTHLHQFLINRPDAIRRLITSKVTFDQSLTHFTNRQPQAIKVVVDY